MSNRSDVTVLASDLINPWGFDFLTPKRIIITELVGRIRILEDGKLSEPLEGVPRVVNLLDVITRPASTQGQSILYTYVFRSLDGDIGMRVVSADVEGNRLINVETVYTTRPLVANNMHFGGRLALVSEQAVLLTVGDHRLIPDSAQDPNADFGKVIKIDLTSGESAHFAQGFRHPQGIAVDESSGEVFLTDHGTIGNDELNLIVEGGNYGWPTYDGNERMEGGESSGVVLQSPVATWTPSIAPGGLSIYSHKGKFENWYGDLLIGSLSKKRLIRVRRVGSSFVQESHLVELDARIRLARSTPEGLIAVITDSPNGMLIEFSPPTSISDACQHE